MISKHWQLQEAKNKFSHLVKLARQVGPQFVTRHGNAEVVIISIEDYRALVGHRESLLHFFQDSPLADEELDFNRNKDTPREVML